MKRPLLTRFMESVELTEGPLGSPCWIWTKSTSGRYGNFWVDGRQQRAHRIGYELFVGPIPEGFQIDHLCRVTMCVNPDHLEAVTPRENTLRSSSPSALAARRTGCTNGHPLEGDNLVASAQGRRCRICQNEMSRRNKERKRRAAGIPVRVTPTHCPQGHPYEGENLRFDKAGKRVCVECVRASRRRSYWKAKERNNGKG